MSKEALLELKNMKKAFGPTVALDDVDLLICRGEIHGLVGENGSGKSTITTIASGMQKATAGDMYFKGEPWNPDTMREAGEKGVGMILQEANTVPHVSVAQNIFAGQEEHFAKFGFVNKKKMYRTADDLLQQFGLSRIHGSDNIDRYSFEDRKLIEIVRVLRNPLELLVVDETTTALSHEGRESLYKIMHQMAAEGKAVVFISHDMDEILEQCTVLTVLRDGKITGTFDEAALERRNDPLQRIDLVKEIRYRMVGREIGDKYYREDFEATHQEEVALEFDRVSFGHIADFSLKVYKGEIVGLGGLSSCGMHEVGRVAFGLEKIVAGHVLRNGKEIRTCASAVDAGIGYISKNRDSEALILEGSITDNVVFPSLKRLKTHRLLDPRKIKSLSKQEIENFRIKCRNGNQWVNTLSGGNKQKVSFAKWSALECDVMIMDCPTRGVDIGVKQAMYGVIEKMKQEGKSIIIISEELPELIGMCDRLYIMKDFAIRKEFLRSAELKEKDLIEYMI